MLCSPRLKWLLLASLVGVSPSLSAEPAKGTLNHAAKSGPVVVNVKYAFLVKGPDDMSGKPMRQLILSDVDLASHIKGCATLSCATNKLESGMTVDFDTGPRLNFWFVGNGQRVQASGTAQPETMKLTANTPAGENSSWWQRLTGTEKKTAVPLPRTDLPESGSAPAKPLAFPASNVPIEF